MSDYVRHAGHEARYHLDSYKDNNGAGFRLPKERILIYAKMLRVMGYDEPLRDNISEEEIVLIYNLWVVKSITGV